MQLRVKLRRDTVLVSPSVWLNHIRVGLVYWIADPWSVVAVDIPDTSDGDGPIAAERLARWLRFLRLLLTVVLLLVAVWRALGPG